MNQSGQDYSDPSGEKLVHDGYFFAGDTEKQLKAFIIDVFGEIFTSNPFPSFIGSGSSSKFDAY